LTAKTVTASKAANTGIIMTAGFLELRVFHQALAELEVLPLGARLHRQKRSHDQDVDADADFPLDDP
jgi:hypothetical protein